jgi:hypothetical protein
LVWPQPAIVDSESTISRCTLYTAGKLTADSTELDEIPGVSHLA